MIFSKVQTRCKRRCRPYCMSILKSTNCTFFQDIFSSKSLENNHTKNSTHTHQTIHQTKMICGKVCQECKGIPSHFTRLCIPDFQWCIYICDVPEEPFKARLSLLRANSTLQTAWGTLVPRRASDQQKHLRKSKAYYLLCYHNICQPVDSVRLVLHIHPYKIQYDTVL